MAIQWFSLDSDPMVHPQSCYSPLFVQDHMLAKIICFHTCLCCKMLKIPNCRPIQRQKCVALVRVWRREPGNHWELNWRHGDRGRGSGGNSQRPPAHFSSSCPRLLARFSCMPSTCKIPGTAFFCVGGASLSAGCSFRVRQGVPGQRASFRVQGRARGRGCT